MLREITEDEFYEDIREGLVLADFYSPTCGPCKMLSFVLEDVDKACKDRAEIVKINVDENERLAEKYGIIAYPTMILLKNGEELKRVIGLQQKPAILKMIEEA
ncbi:MAG: thioredoxin [Lachnospiraceae bacterium]|nr:thioredoxin [Lachnospiraceae bacterium]